MGGRPITIGLPMPPSVNTIWRSKRARGGKPKVYTSPQYKAWLNECDALCMEHRWHKHGVRSGEYRIEVTLNNSKRRGDCDNRIKPILDWLARSGITPDDRHCNAASVEWGELPESVGCSVAIHPEGA